MAVSFWYVRHGKTEYNTLGRMQGQADSPLTEEGKACMQKTAGALKNIFFEHAYTSPLGRCMETSEILLQYHPETALTPDDDLKEMSFGDLDGRKFSENRDLIAECLKEGSFHSVHGESDQDVFHRCRRCFSRIIQENPDGSNILIVSHGAYLRRLYAALFRKKVLSAETEIPNGSITRFDYEKGNYILLSLPLTPEEYTERSGK